MINDIAMDLKRASLGSDFVSKIFLSEAIDKISKIKEKLPKYIYDIFDKIKKTSNKEDYLMYSTLLQNYYLKYEK